MTDPEMYQLIAKELKLNALQVKNTIDLLDSGNTVPFISRYRKEVTGSLDEEQIRQVEERINYLRALEARKDTIIHSIKEQEKLTPELEKRIRSCVRLQELEDLYLPYKPKKRTRATIAHERGLEALARVILNPGVDDRDPLQVAAAFIDTEKGVSNAEEALRGARDIIAEMISEDADIRSRLREATFEDARIRVQAKKTEGRTAYETYYDFDEAVKKIVPHRILAINRGESDGVLRVGIHADKDEMCGLIQRGYKTTDAFAEQLNTAIADSYSRLLAPSLAREVRNTLTEKADAHAIEVFATNLRNLLLQPPVRGSIIMGIDPGFRTGSKVAVIDETGKYLEGLTIYPHPPQNKYLEAKAAVRHLIEKHKVDIIAIGNGTASRETEQMAAEIISEIKDQQNLAYIIVNEAGASVYSASKTAREEFPDLEASMRGNISIARRLLDPLAELVKIDPKSIGVGLYQHDVNQRQLMFSLGQVVESCVNSIGVNLNTASASLLRHISGLTSRTAQNIVAYRDENGAFQNRKELKKVPAIGAIAFEQAAGFLRIPKGDNILDNTSIHPESYMAAEKILKVFNIEDISREGRLIRSRVEENHAGLEGLLTELGIGKPTFEDILDNFEKPGLDPRDALPKPILKSDVLKIEDLKEGMTLKGTVRNVVDFGAFIDIGVKQDGLVHVSQMADKFVKNPHKVVSVGDIVDVRVTKIDMERGRIGLSMKNIHP